MWQFPLTSFWLSIVWFLLSCLTSYVRMPFLTLCLSLFTKFNIVFQTFDVMPNLFIHNIIVRPLVLLLLKAFINYNQQFSLIVLKPSFKYQASSHCRPTFYPLHFPKALLLPWDTCPNIYLYNLLSISPLLFTSTFILNSIEYNFSSPIKNHNSHTLKTIILPLPFSLSYVNALYKIETYYPHTTLVNLGS